MKQILFAVSILFAASLACGSQEGTAIQPNIEPNASSPAPGATATEFLPGASAPTMMPQNTTSGANLELTTYLQKSEDIGNGQKRVTIVFDGRNASNGWYGYSLSAIPAGCVWLTPDAVSIKTQEGFTYPPAYDMDDCGSRNTYLVPPGGIFSWVGQDLSNNQGWWGRVGFDIPQNATPKEITIGYSWSGLHTGSGIGVAQSVTTPVLPISEARNVDNPFDGRYADAIKIVKAGDKVAFGDLATFAFTVKDAKPDGSFPIELNVTSTDQAYPLSLKQGFLGPYGSTYLLYQDGTACCKQYWIEDPAFSLGPQQTILLPANNAVVAPNPNHLKVWLVGDFTLVEINGGSREASEQFVVELPNSPNTSSQTAVTPETASAPSPQYLDPQGAPVSEWNSVPIMTQATAGQEFSQSTYSYRVRDVAAQDVQTFYNDKLKAAGWSSPFSGQVESTGGLILFTKGAKVLSITITPSNKDFIVLLVLQ